jgi:cell division cycle 20-like protein 1 (cofactor of APC complex)
MQVTKLCELGEDDDVCSVGWAQPGTHLAVGTKQGKVQVTSCSHLKLLGGMFMILSLSMTL